MGAFIILLILAAVGGAVWYLRRGGGTAHGAGAATAETRIMEAHGIKPVAKPQAQRRPGRMINPGPVCCAEAHKLETTWFADDAAPRLPLDGCDQLQNCRCQWTRVLDRRETHRRSGHDRRGDLRFEDKPDRRGGNDRRKSNRDFWKGAG